MRVLIVIAIFCSLTLRGQSDSLILTPKQFLFFVNKFHPVSKKANLLLDQGKQKVRKARGGFDPKIQSDYNQKDYKETNYYSLWTSMVKVPTWYGIEFKAGLDQAEGTYINEENTLPSNGLVIAGVSVPVGRNLLMDERRATLKQAKIFEQSSQAERINILNNLSFESIKTYWKWVQAWNDYKIYEQGLSLAEGRFVGVKQAFTFGDKSAIDTLEAYIQVQNRMVNRNEALLKYKNIGLTLSNYLWNEDGKPLELVDGVHPPVAQMEEDLNEVSNEEYVVMLNNVSKTHPELQMYNLKMDKLTIEKRLMQEGLKPKLNLTYNALNEPVGGSPFNDFNPNNFKFGFNFSYSLFLRKEIASVKLTKIKLKDADISRNEKELALRNKMKTYFNYHLNLQDQVKLSRQVVEDYEALLKGEMQKFNSGESSIFLLNYRESSLIKAQLKLNAMIAKYHIANAGVYWAAGTLGNKN